MAHHIPIWKTIYRISARYRYLSSDSIFISPVVRIKDPTSAAQFHNFLHKRKKYFYCEDSEKERKKTIEKGREHSLIVEKPFKQKHFVIVKLR